MLISVVRMVFAWFSCWRGPGASCCGLMQICALSELYIFQASRTKLLTGPLQGEWKLNPTPAQFFEILVAPKHASALWFPTMIESFGAPMVQRHTIAGRQFNPAFFFDRPAPVGLAPEWECLESIGLPPAVVHTIQGSRALTFSERSQKTPACDENNSASVGFTPATTQPL